MKPDNVTGVKAGTTIEAPGKTGRMIVSPGCPDKHNGRWYCVTHDTLFDTQLEKDIHIGAGNRTHLLAWVCNEHGIEQP